MLEYRKFTDDEIKKICKNIVILVDKREKSTYVKDWCAHKNRCKTEDFTLEQGDYSFKLPAMPEYGITTDLYFDRKIAIERKNSLDEISRNFTDGRSRFKEEFAMFPGKMTVIINDTWTNLFMGKYKSGYNRVSFIGSVQSFSHRYDISFQFMTVEEFPVFVYTHFYYYLRSILKGEQK